MSKTFQYTTGETYLHSSSSLISLSSLPLIFFSRSVEMILELFSSPEALKEVILIISVMDKPPKHGNRVKIRLSVLQRSQGPYKMHGGITLSIKYKSLQGEKKSNSIMTPQDEDKNKIQHM